MFAAGKMTHRPLPIPVMARFGSGGHEGAVPVGKINTIYPGPGGYWGDGVFLDPTYAPEVPRAVYMLQEKVLGPSVDLDRDFTVKVVPHPSRPDKKATYFEEYNVIGTTLVPMPAFYQVHLSVDTVEEKSLLASAGINVDLFLDKDAYETAAGTELVYAASFKELDEAECGCITSESPETFSQETEPRTPGVGAMELLTNSTTPGQSVTIGTSVVPSTVTMTFGQPGFNMYYPPTSDNPSTSGNPLAVVKVMDNKTVIKIPTNQSDEDHQFNEDGHCMACGY